MGFLVVNLLNRIAVEAKINFSEVVFDLENRIQALAPLKPT